MGKVINCEKEIIEYFKKRSDVYFDTTGVYRNVRAESSSIKIHCSFFIFQNKNQGLFKEFVEGNKMDECHKMLLEHILPILKKYGVNFVNLTIPESVSSNDKGMSANKYYINHQSSEITLIGHEPSKLW